MDTNDLILKDEVYRIVGAAFAMLKELGHGLHEKPYENALVVEFGLAGISCEQQRRFPVIYKTVEVSEYVPDLIAFGSVIVDTKVIDHITDHETLRWVNSELQARETRMGARCPFRSFALIRGHSRLKTHRIFPLFRHPPPPDS